MRWEVDGRQPDALAAVLRWTSSQLLGLFPFEHHLRIETQIRSGELRIATTLYATGQDSVPVCFGYHPYLRIPDALRETWRVTLGAFRRLVLDEDMIPTGEREPIERRWRITIADRSRAATSVSRPVRDFPARWRSSGVSSP